MEKLNESRMLKLILPAALVAVVVFLAINNFICSPAGLAPEFKEIKSCKIEDFKADSIKINIIAAAENKNDIKIEVENLNVTVMHGNTALGFAERKEKWEIEASDIGEIELSSSLDTKKILQIISEDPDSLDLTLVGNADADLGLITLPVDIDIEFSIDVKEQLARTIKNDTDNDKIIKISSAGFKNLKLGGSVVEVSLEIHNPYGIEFTVEGYPSKLFMSGSELGEGDVSEEIIVKQKGEVSEGKITYNISNTQTLASLFGSFFSRKLEYETKGNLLLNILGYNIKVPYSKKGVLAKL